MMVEPAFIGPASRMILPPQRYVVSNKVLRRWAAMIRDLDIDIIAPQHGALFKGKEMVTRFIDWCETLECGIDLMEDVYKLPS